jgi:hypothetical protein
MATKMVKKMYTGTRVVDDLLEKFPVGERIYG